MNNSIFLMQLVSYGTLALLMTASFLAFLIHYIKGKTIFKTREEILKITFAGSVDFLAVLTRIVLINYGVRSTLVCHMFVLEVFLDLYIFFTLFQLFYYIRRTTSPTKTKRNFIAMFSDLLAWVFLSTLISVVLTNSDDNYLFILNLQTFYLLPYSMLVLAVAFVVPRSLKTFKELKLSFFILAIAFFLEYISKQEYFSIQMIELIFSMKLFAFISIIFNFYKITLSTPESFDNLKKKKKEEV